MKNLFILLLLAMIFSGCKFGALRDMGGELDEPQALNNFIDADGSQQAAFSNPQECGNLCMLGYCDVLEANPGGDCALKSKLALIQFCPIMIALSRTSAVVLKPLSILRSKSFASVEAIDINASAISSAKGSISCAIFDKVIDEAGCQVDDPDLLDVQRNDVIEAVLACYNFAGPCLNTLTNLEDIKNIYYQCQNGLIESFNIECDKDDVIPTDPDEGEIVSIPTDNCKEKCIEPKTCYERECVCKDFIVDSKECYLNFEDFMDALKGRSCEKADYYLQIMKDACCSQFPEAQAVYGKNCSDSSTVDSNIRIIKEIYKKPVFSDEPEEAVYENFIPIEIKSR